ncbi:MAG: TetR/AcrR family transcriptional regulator [Myxococcota bacterium]
MTERIQEERSRRIVESAVVLAEQGGFEAVRLRDIASHANVALGTVYKRFSSKEDILVAAMERELNLLEELVRTTPPKGDTYSARLAAFFDLVTSGFFARPKLSRAGLKATASGDPELAEKVGRFHSRITRLIATTLEGEDGDTEVAGLNDDQIQELAFLCSQMLFSALVGWMGGLFDQEDVRRQVQRTAQLLLRGMHATA